MNGTQAKSRRVNQLKQADLKGRRPNRERNANVHLAGEASSYKLINMGLSVKGGAVWSGYQSLSNPLGSNSKTPWAQTAGP